jgi:hypothetical protein
MVERKSLIEKLRLFGGYDHSWEAVSIIYVLLNQVSLTLPDDNNLAADLLGD